VPDLAIVVSRFKIPTLSVNYIRVLILSLLVNFFVKAIDRILT